MRSIPGRFKISAQSFLASPSWPDFWGSCQFDRFLNAAKIDRGSTYAHFAGDIVARVLLLIAITTFGGKTGSTGEML